MRKVTFGLIVGTRGFFNSELASVGRTELTTLLDKLGFAYVMLPTEATPTGSIETIADARKVADLFIEYRKQIDGIIVSLPNFGDELGIVNAIKWANLNVPVLVQATDDEIGKDSIAERRDAFCGKLSVCNNLYYYQIPFTNTTNHTCKINSKVFETDIIRFASVCRVTNGLRNARIGAIGARPAAFQTMRFSEKILQTAGITVVPVDMSEILSAASKIDNNATELKAKLEAIKQYGKIPESIAYENILKQAKFGIAAENWIAQNEIDAAAFQCWTSIQENYGCASCLTMSMLGDKLIPAACEVDVCGVISMYALTLASGNASALLDWNNNYGNDLNKCVCTHCSNYPKSFIQNEIEISNLDILGASLGADKCFGAIKGRVNEGPFTFFRIATDDLKGNIKAYIGQGQYTNDPNKMDGGIAVTQINNLQVLMNYLCKNGFEHHVAMSRGHVAGIVEEAATNYLGWDCYRHQ